MSMDLAKFYDEVIKDMTQKLNKRYQTRDGMDANIIENLIIKVREKLKNPQMLFGKAIANLHRQEHPVTQQTHLQANKEIQEIQVKSQAANSDEESEMSDDLQKFHVKQEQHEQYSQEKLQKVERIQPKQQENIDGDQQDSDQSKDQKMSKAKKNISMHIVGAYSPGQKKHIAKDQKTKLQLDNVFIKVNTFGNSINQICFTRVCWELKKTQGQGINF